MDIGGDGGVSLGNAEQNHSNQPSCLNISDVFEAISIADPTFDTDAVVVDEAMSRPPAQQHQGPHVRIVEEPASKALRFRYECEGRSAGSIPGVNNTPENRTYPTVKICGYTGLVTIVVSCVTKDEPFRPHPHNLVGRDRCDRGVCTVRTEITEENSEYQFRNLGIQCVKRRDIGEALRVREELRVDPFRTGFGHRNHPQSIDLNAVRLGFQVFLPDSAGKMRRPLAPVASDVIYDKKAMSDLLIVRASHCAGPARGGTQLILLCEKVTREDTAVVFYQEENNQVIWEESAIIMLVHKQVAIAFETPPYKNPNISEHVKVRFQLKRVTDNTRSNSLPFEYIPEYQESIYIGGKKRKTLIPSLLQSTYEPDRIFQQEQKIKAEPRDKTSPLHMSTSPHHMSPSPLHVYHQYGDQNWQMNVDMQGGLAVAGHSHINPFQDIPWTGPNYGQTLSPNIQPGNMQPHSPTMQAVSPGHIMSPHLQVMPNMGQSPMHGGVSPMSPMGQAQSPMAQALSPMAQALSPVAQAMSPMQAGHISPNLVQQASYNQCNSQVVPQQMMDTNVTPSFSSLLQERVDSSIQLNSGELSGLSSLLGDRHQDLLPADLKLSSNDLFL